MVQIKKIELNINNKELMQEFYSNILKLELVAENDDMLAYAVSKDEKPIIILNVIDTKVKQRENTLYHYALLLPERKYLGAFLKHMIVQQYPAMDGGADHLVSEALYLRDPEGNTIEIYADKDEKQWIWQDGKVVMDTLQLDTESLIANTNKWEKFPQETTIGHLHFYGANLNEADAFFVQLLGQDLVSELGDGAHFYSYQNYHHHFALNIWQGTHYPNRTEKSLGMNKWYMCVSEKCYEHIVLQLQKMNYPYKEKNEVLTFIDPVGSTAIIYR